MRSSIEKIVKIFPQNLISEFHRIFGKEATEKLLTIFAGVTLHIPSTKEIEEAVRNIAIYETLIASRSGVETRRLSGIMCEQYDLTRKELRAAFRKTRRELNEARRTTAADQKIGEMTPRSLKQKSKKRAM
jgi:hypothetical protein